MSNYPDDVNPNDPRAPWNYDEDKFTKWEFCHVNFCEKCTEPKDLNEDEICEDCFEPEEIENDLF